ncbi:hypothetical protein lerEdw1_021036 [Lerista edwardsae]|nr:hypothetical protein lerEdw1_021036 [Lerista edwardsae]
MLRMTWDPALAKTAKAWAKRCIFDHNIYLKRPGKVHPEFTPVGENIWTGSLVLFSVESAIRSWYDEVKDYDWESRACAKICGHYTQTHLCLCSCSGNYPRHPYTQGRTCSACEVQDTCAQNLCGKDFVIREPAS